MRKAALAVVILIGVFLIVGSSGNFRTYTASRGATVGIVSGENSYVGFTCPPETVDVEAGSDVEFTLVSVRNLMNVTIVVHVEANFSGLPEGANGTLDEPNAILQPGEEVHFQARVDVDNFTDGGLYEIPVRIQATWNGGSAKIEACSAVLNVTAKPLVIEKRLVFGNVTFPVNTHQSWVMEVRFKNNGDPGDFTVVDFVNPMLFNVDGVTVSKGTPVWGLGLIIWDVHLENGEIATMRIAVENLNWCHHSSTPCPCNYSLNTGACVLKIGCSCHNTCPHYDNTCCLVRSNGITVTATEGD